MDRDRLESLASAALTEGEEIQALELIVPAAQKLGSARLWQWAGLLQRALDEHGDALESFDRAHMLAPRDQLIAHSRARVHLEAGLDSVSLFEEAARLGPASSDILLGLAAARLAAGDGDLALAELERLLDQSPFWLDGHRQFAQLCSLLGDGDRSMHSLERALTDHPTDFRLWATRFDLDIKASDFASLSANVVRARASGLSENITSFEAVAAAELGDADRADALFAAIDPPPVWLIRHLLRTARPAEGVKVIDGALQGPQAAAIWPYAVTAWQLADDPRFEWLIDADKFVRTFDLSERLPPLDELANVLRSLHRSRGTYLDQSVRGGTQTDGPLFCRIDPAMRQLRSAVVHAVERYVTDLPPLDGNHPLLSHRRDRRTRFSGSWSVRLSSGGHHSNHVHPMGWISSALYVALPSTGDGDSANAGWFALGQPDAKLALDMQPWRTIEPKPGMLVLFPSYLWHGTVPFQKGERLTVAFDVAPPR